MAPTDLVLVGVLLAGAHAQSAAVGLVLAGAAVVHAEHGPGGHSGDGDGRVCIRQGGADLQV